MSVTKRDDDGFYPAPAMLREPTVPVERQLLLDEAEASIMAGQGVPHDQVVAWLFELAAGRPAKAPCGE